MVRIAIFAHYDKDGVVHDYVLGYLKYLKEVADKVIFIADNYAEKREKDKVKNLVDYAEFSPHGEYDFGSYKRGYSYAKINGWLNSADELIFCNDSCFCVKSLIPVFEAMSERSCDFWGITESNEIQNHLQSYFLVFKSNVFNSKVFVDHINSVTHKNNFVDIVKCYEVPFASKLNEASFTGRGYVQFRKICNPTCYPYKTYKNGVPLIKKKVFAIEKYCDESLWLILMLLLKNKLLRSYVEEYFSVSSFVILGKFYKRVLFHFFFQKKITKSGKLRIKICKIPVYAKRIDKR